MSIFIYILVLSFCLFIKAQEQFISTVDGYTSDSCFRQYTYNKEDSNAVEQCIRAGCQSISGSNGLPTDTCGLCIGSCWSLINAGASAITMFGVSDAQCQIYARATSAASNGVTVYAMMDYPDFQYGCTLLAGGERATVNWPVNLAWDNWCQNHGDTVCSPGNFLMSSPDITECDSQPKDEGPNYFALTASKSSNGPTVIMCWGQSCYDANLPRAVTKDLNCQDIIQNQRGKLVKACSETTGSSSTVGTTIGTSATAGISDWSPELTATVSTDVSSSYTSDSSVTCN